MNTIFMNSKNGKTSDPHRLNLTDKIDLKRKKKYLASWKKIKMEKYNMGKKNGEKTWKNIKKWYKNNKFKISAPTWNEKFELLDGSYSLSEIQGYFKYILKKHGWKTVDPSIRICINKVVNRITFEIKTEYYIELLTPETLKLRESTKSKITENENGENVPYLILKLK